MGEERVFVKVMDQDAFDELYWKAAEGDKEALRNMKHAYVAALIALERLDDEFDIIEAYLTDSRVILVRTLPAEVVDLFSEEEIEKNFSKNRPG